MTTGGDSDSHSSNGGEMGDFSNPSMEKNGIKEAKALRKLDNIKIIQVANIAPQATKDQMQNLFGYIGKLEDIRLYPTM